MFTAGWLRCSRRRSVATALRLAGRGDWREFARRLLRRQQAVPVLPLQPPRPKPPRPAGPVTLALVAHSLERDGAPLSQYELALGLHEAGRIRPHVIAFADGPVAALYRAAGIPVTLFPHRLLTRRDYAAAAAALADLFHQAGAQAVLANTLQTFLAVAAAGLAGLPVLWNPRESEPWQGYFDFLPPDLQAEARAGFHRADSVVFVAEATRAAWQPLLLRDNHRVIRNALRDVDLGARADSRIRLGLDDDTLSVLCLGTLCERKGQADLVAAARHLPETMRIDLVGRAEPPYADRLRREAAGLGRRVRLLPATDAPHHHLAAADVFVCCSRVESYPRVVLEAMAHGLAIVSTPVFGIAEQLSHSRNALLYQPGDVAALAGHLGALADPALRRRLGAQAAADFRELSDYSAMVAAYGAAIADLFCA